MLRCYKFTATKETGRTKDLSCTPKYIYFLVIRGQDIVGETATGMNIVPIFSKVSQSYYVRRIIGQRSSEASISTSLSILMRLYEYFMAIYFEGSLAEDYVSRIEVK